MNKTGKTIFTTIRVISFMLAMATNVNLANAHIYKSPTPKDYHKYMVVVGKGNFESVDGSAFRDGLIAGDGLDFQKSIMGRNDQEVEVVKHDAINFFVERFGIDVYNFQNVYFTGFEMDPRVDTRTYTVSNERVSGEGWKTLNGGWLVVVTNPNGIELGGQFAGQHVAPGTVFVTCEFWVERPGHKQPLVLRRRSPNPLIPHPGIGDTVRYLVQDDMDNPKYGIGKLQGVSALSNLDNGFINFDFRAVVTIP